MKYFYRSMTDTKLHWTKGIFVGWNFGGPLDIRYATFQRKCDTLFIPEYLLTKETKEALANATKEV